MTMCDQDLLKRQNALAGVNIAWLHQALDAIEGLDDEGYAVAGAQFRHVIEFYECFLEGLAVFHIDYDGRRRDLVLEQQRRVAGARIRTLINRLSAEPELDRDGSVFVRMEDAQAMGVPAAFLLSSVGRELQALSSHTIHHFAVIALMLRAAGYPVAESFGVAPSTLRHREQMRIHAVAA